MRMLAEGVELIVAGFVREVIIDHSWTHMIGP